MQDEDIKKLLRQNLELTRENNKMLRKIRRSALIGFVVRILWVAILIGVPVYMYFNFIEPSLAGLAETYQGVKSGANNMQDFLEKIPFVGDILSGDGGGIDAEVIQQ